MSRGKIVPVFFFLRSNVTYPSYMRCTATGQLHILLLFFDLFLANMWLLLQVNNDSQFLKIVCELLDHLFCLKLNNIYEIIIGRIMLDYLNNSTSID